MQTLPATALSTIFDYLELKDQIAASSTCWAWRHCLFQKRYFKNFRFHLNIAHDDQLAFFHQIFATLAREVVIEFDFLDPTHLQKLHHLLCTIIHSENIQKVRFHTNNVGLVAAGNTEIHDQRLIDIEQCIVEPLKVLLARKRLPCQVLDLGAIEVLTFYGLDFLQALVKPQELQELHLASIKYDPSHYPILSLDTTLLQKCAALQILSFDFDTLSDELLHTIQVLPLRKLLIAVHGVDINYESTSSQAWRNFSNHFSGIDVILTFIYAYEAIGSLQVCILRQHMPLTHVRFLFCEILSHEALDRLSQYTADTLRSVYYVDSPGQRHSSRLMALDYYNGQNPFVMMSWRCKQLQELVVHGHTMDPRDLVGIARLRGRQLKHLEVSDIGSTNKTNMVAFNKEIFRLVGNSWMPIKENRVLFPLDCVLTAADRNKYVYELLRNDLVN